MRVIVILFLGIAVVALVLKFFPSSAAPGTTPALAAEIAAESDADSANGEQSPGPRVLSPSESGSQPELAVPPQNTAGRAQSGIPAVSRPGLRPSATLLDVPALAGALLHETPAAFRAFLEQSQLELPESRQRMMLAFSLAMAGRATEAVELAGDVAPGEGIEQAEFLLLKAAVGGSRSGPMEAGAARSGSVEFAMELALLARAGERLLERREWKAAAEALSKLLLGDVRAPWPSKPAFSAVWAERLNEAQAHHRWNPKGSWAAVKEAVLPGDNLSVIRARAVERVPGLLLCTGMIQRVNGIGDRYLQAGEELRIPTDLASTLVDLEARCVFFMLGNEVAAAWPVAIGAPGNETPEGSFLVGELIPEPPWFRPGEAMIPFGDPGNRLGTRWIGWLNPDGRASHYGFHGTWEPETIGQAVSDGCIRLRNSDVEQLYKIVPRGSTITVQS